MVRGAGDQPDMTSPKAYREWMTANGFSSEVQEQSVSMYFEGDRKLSTAETKARLSEWRAGRYEDWE